MAIASPVLARVLQLKLAILGMADVRTALAFNTTGATLFSQLSPILLLGRSAAQLLFLKKSRF